MAEKKFLVDLNLTGNKAKNFRLEDYADNTAPTSNFVGRMIYTTNSTALDRLELYTGDGWKQVAYLDDAPALDQDLIDIAALTGNGILARQSGVWTMDTNTYLTSADLSGYLTSESDPIYTGSSWYTTTNNSSNWDTAYGWGNHSSAGYVTLTGTETLSNKTISDSLSFTNTGSASTITADGNDLGIYSNGTIALTSNSADIVLQPDGTAKVWNNEILTDNGWAIITNKNYNGLLQFNPISGAQPNTGYAEIQYKDTNDGVTAGNEGIYISAHQGWSSPISGGKMYITSHGDMTIESTAGNMQFFMDGGMYIGAVDSGNQIIKRSDLSSYLTTESDPIYTGSSWYTTTNNSSNWDAAHGWGNHASAGYLTSAVTSIANTDGNISFDVSTGSVTANLASSIELAGDLVVQGDLTVNGDVTTLNTATMLVEDNIFVLNSNVTGTPTLNAGLEVERGSYTNASIYWNETSNLWSVDTAKDSSAAAVSHSVARKYSETLSATPSATSFVITHSLNTRDIVVNVYETASPYAQVDTAVEFTSVDTITVSFNEATSGTYRVVVVG